MLQAQPIFSANISVLGPARNFYVEVKLRIIFGSSWNPSSKIWVKLKSRRAIRSSKSIFCGLFESSMVFSYHFLIEHSLFISRGLNLGTIPIVPQTLKAAARLCLRISNESITELNTSLIIQRNSAFAKG